MLNKTLRMKQNNNGFSLVELIVVVLIIAIIAVALAPQVMKWVGTSKINVDKSNASTFKASIHAGVADFMATNSVYNITGCSAININGLAPGASTLGDAQDKIAATVNNEWPESVASNKGFQVSITTSGGVTVEYWDTTLAVPDWKKSK